MEVVSQALECCKLGKIKEVEISPCLHPVIEAVSRFEQGEKRVSAGCGAMCAVEPKEPLCRQTDIHNVILVGHAHLSNLVARVQFSREDGFAYASRDRRHLTRRQGWGASRLHNADDGEPATAIAPRSRSAEVQRGIASPGDCANGWPTFQAHAWVSRIPVVSYSIKIRFGRREPISALSDPFNGASVAV